MDSGMVAISFVQHYYHMFDSNRAGLRGIQLSRPLHQCQHYVSTIDCQPSGLAGGFLIFVTGTVQLASEQHALKFNEMFNLMPGWGKYFIVNDIFRLNYAYRQ
ncbi:hypothetical protein UlMin_008860 [Ulmus minor]